MKNKIKKILLLLSIFALAGCAEDFKKYDFKKINGSKKTTVRLEALQGQKAVHAINIRIIGSIDGKGHIAWGATQKNKDISGKVDLNWSNEWYEPNCEIEYTPITAKSGELKIYYKFEDI